MTGTGFNEIIKKEQLSDIVYRYRIYTPRIAKKHQAGQFIILRSYNEGERIPLTIANSNGAEGWIELIFQAVGLETKKLAQLNPGDCLESLVGPLGRATHIENFGRCVGIAGGVGIAPLYPIVCALKKAGNDLTTILGSRSKDLLILEDEMREQSDKLLIATDDSSYGHHGFAADVFNKLIADGEKFDFAIVIGPPMMMKVTCNLTVKAGIKTFASLNPIMVDGTGMCGGCRVLVHGETKFACIDGPEFDASGIDWDILIKRLQSYTDFERKQHKMLDKDCKLGDAE